MMDIDLFSGPGGLDQGALAAGVATTGFELDDDAVATARAAGHERVQGDVSRLDPASFGPARSVIGSPPCQPFTLAGIGRGRADAALIIEAVEAIASGADAEDTRDRLKPRMTDPRSALVLEPLRWVAALRPEWVALEQVAPVLPIWEAYAHALDALGYGTATGVLSSETFGVPQTRRRAILIARLGEDATLPAPTHAAYRSNGPGQPWVSMRDALGRDGFVQVSNYTDRYTASGRGERTADQPSFTITGKPPSFRTAGGTVRASVQEVGVLQTFPADYPWRGGKTSQYQQVGNAVPPVMAAAIIKAASGAV